MENLFFLFLIATVAFLYSSVGHGGASGYLALMALYNFNPVEMRTSALLLNILVSAIAFYQYYKSGNFRRKIFFPFAILSVPMAFAGAKINLDSTVYKIILGICLLFATFRLLGIFGKQISSEKKEIHFTGAMFIGGAIGFISGIIGIGGGILLSPVLIFLRWADLKETAAVSALFILINSVSGFAGILHNGTSFSNELIFWIVAAVAGGLSGAYFGSSIMNNAMLRYLLSAVLIFASIKLLII